MNPSATPSYMLQIPEFSERTPFSLKARLHNIRVFMGPSEPTLSSQIKGNRSALSPVIQHVAYSRNNLIIYLQGLIICSVVEFKKLMQVSNL